MKLSEPEELKQESNVFLLKHYPQIGTGFMPQTIYELAWDYVLKNQHRFKNIDRITSDRIANSTIENGYVEKIQDSGGRDYHILTEDGNEFIEKHKRGN